MAVPPKGWDKIEVDYKGPIRNAQFYNQMARQAAFEKDLSYIDGLLIKAAKKGLRCIKVDRLSDDMSRHLESLGFVVANEDIGVDIFFF